MDTSADFFAKLFGKPDEDGFKIKDNRLISYADKNASFVAVPEGVTVICDGAFSKMKALSEIRLPKSLKAIGHNAFAGCVSLADIKLPENLEFIGSRAFSKCASLSSIIVPSSVRTVDECAFPKTLKDAYFVDKPFKPECFEGESTVVHLSGYSFDWAVKRYAGHNPVTTLNTAMIPLGTNRYGEPITDALIRIKINAPTKNICFQDGSNIWVGMPEMIELSVFDRDGNVLYSNPNFFVDPIKDRGRDERKKLADDRFPGHLFGYPWEITWIMNHKEFKKYENNSDDNDDNDYNESEELLGTMLRMKTSKGEKVYTRKSNSITLSFPVRIESGVFNPAKLSFIKAFWPHYDELNSFIGSKDFIILNLLDYDNMIFEAIESAVLFAITPDFTGPEWTVLESNPNKKEEDYYDGDDHDDDDDADDYDDNDDDDNDDDDDDNDDDNDNDNDDALNDLFELSDGEEAVSITLISPGPKKKTTIINICQLCGLSLIDSKKKVDSTPCCIVKRCSKQKAEEIKNKLEADGAKVTIE